MGKCSVHTGNRQALFEDIQWLYQNYEVITSSEHEIEPLWDYSLYKPPSPLQAIV